MMKNLSGCKADINEGDYDERTPLHIAARQGHIEIVKFMIEKGVNLSPMDKFGRCPLFEAIVFKQKEMIELLHSSGAELKVGFELLLATLFNCVRDGDLDTIKDFYYTGLRHLENYKNFDSRTIGHVAVCERKLNFIEFLKEEANFDFSVKDRWGKTPLDEAEALGYQEIVDAILSKHH